MTIKHLIKELNLIKLNNRSHGEAVYYHKKNKWYISKDHDCHNGGYWKVATKKPENLYSKNTRYGTYDKFLTKRIGI